MNLLLVNLFVLLIICNAVMSVSNTTVASSQLDLSTSDNSSGEQNSNSTSTVKQKIKRSSTVAECLGGQVFKPPKTENFSLVNETIVFFVKNTKELELNKPELIKDLSKIGTLGVRIPIPSTVYSIQSLVKKMDALVKNFFMTTFKSMRAKWQIYYIEEDGSVCSKHDDTIQLELSKMLLNVLGMNKSSAESKSSSDENELVESESDSNKTYQGSFEPLFGLQNCYCNECDPSKTVGKVFRDKCFFLTLEREFSFNTNTQTLHTDNPLYSVFIARNSKDLLLTEQIAVELVLRNITQSIKFATKMQGEDRNVVKCFQVYRRKYSNIDCLTYMPTVLKAPTGHFKLQPSYEMQAYPECKFDKKAVESSSDVTKCYKIVNDTKCSLVDIETLGDLENIQKYVANVSQNSTYDITYKIKSIDKKLELNAHYLVFSRVQTQREDMNCMYINPFSKTIEYDSCKLSSESICEIISVGNKVEVSTIRTETELRDSTLSRFAVYFLCSVGGMLVVLLFTAFVLFGPLKKFWRPPSNRRYEDLEDRTPIYRGGKLESLG